MGSEFTREPRLLSPVGGLGVVLALALLGELVALALGVVNVPDGYQLGAGTSLVFVFGLIYGSYWVASNLSPERYTRLSYWCLGGALLFLLVNLEFMRALPPSTRFQALTWIRWAVSVGGGVGFLIGVFEARAITRSIEIERSRIRREGLQRERDRLDEFASIVTHDLRNPLSVAKLRLELAREQHDDTEHLEKASEALDRMDDIIDETLTLARQGESVDETTAVDLSAVVHECWATVPTSDAELVLEEMATVRADRNRLQQVFENLFRNAVEHGSPSNRTDSDDAVEHGSPSNRTDSDDAVEHGGQGLTIRVGMLAEGGGFYIEDNGPGIPEDEREQVREVSYTTAENGGGFGLAIVDRIVSAHDWDLQITEGTDGGARFEITGITVVEE